MKKLIYLYTAIICICLVSCQKGDSVGLDGNAKKLLPAAQYGNIELFNNLYEQIYSVVEGAETDALWNDINECLTIEDGSIEDWENSNCFSLISETSIWQEYTRIANEFFGIDIDYSTSLNSDIVFNLIEEINNVGYVQIEQIYTWAEEHELQELEIMSLLCFNAYGQHSIKNTFVIINNGNEKKLGTLPASGYPNSQYKDPRVIYEYYIEDQIWDDYEHVPDLLLGGNYTPYDSLLYTSIPRQYSDLRVKLENGILYYANASCQEEWLSALAAERERYERELDYITTHAHANSPLSETQLHVCNQAILAAAERHNRIVAQINAQYQACLSGQ